MNEQSTATNYADENIFCTEFVMVTPLTKQDIVLTPISAFLLCYNSASITAEQSNDFN